MSRSIKLVAPIALLITMAACQSADPEFSEADKAAIRGVVDTYTKAVLAADWDAWGKTLAEDVYASPPNTAPMKGRAASVAWVKTFPKITGFVVNLEELEGSGDIAYGRGTYTLSLTLPDSSTMTENGAFVQVHHRQPDGSWPYTHLVYHSVDPLPPSQPAVVKK